MAKRESNSEREMLANLVSDYRRALAALQDLTEEFAARLSGGVLEAARVQPPLDEVERRGILEINCLGPFSVRFDGRAIVLPASGRPAAVFKVLADRGGRPLSRDQLIELVWPGVSTQAGANRLRVAVHALRQAFEEGADLVSYEAGAYRLQAEHIEIDAERFETLVEQGRQLAQDGDDDGARRAYEAAERLYGGDYFQDDPFEEWATTRRQHLRDLYLNLLVKLAILAMERADFDACVGYGHAIVREDALSEDAYRLLMLAHARLGNRARALRWYELCAQALRRELNLTPSAATERLRDEILSEEAAAGRSVRERLGLGAIGGVGSG